MSNGWDARSLSSASSTFFTPALEKCVPTSHSKTRPQERDLIEFPVRGRAQIEVLCPRFHGVSVEHRNGPGNSGKQARLCGCWCWRPTHKRGGSWERGAPRTPPYTWGCLPIKQCMQQMWWTSQRASEQSLLEEQMEKSCQAQWQLPGRGPGLKVPCSVRWRVAGSWLVSQQGRQGQILVDAAARCSHAPPWSRPTLWALWVWKLPVSSSQIWVSNRNGKARVPMFL